MIINVWRPRSKYIDNKQVIIYYELCNIDDIYKSGSSNLKVIYICDNDSCKNSNKKYAISRHHLSKKRSKTVNEEIQICRSCQTKGENNPRWGDNRTWDEIHGIYKSSLLKDCKRKLFIENNPSNNIEVINKKKKNNLEKWGVENVFQLEFVKDKIKKTNLEKFGYESPMKSELIKNKIKETNLEKWGVENVLQSKDVRDKSKLTSLDRYGFEYPQKSNIIKDKIKKTNLEKLGVDNYMKDEFFRSSFMISKNINYIKYLESGISLFRCDVGCNHTFEISSDIFLSRNKIGTKLCTICNPIGDFKSYKEIELFNYIKFIYSGEVIQSYRDGLEIDIYLPNLKLGFEFNGLYWHSEKHKDKNYHKNKTNYFKERNIRIIHIWEDDWVNKNEIIKSQIKNLLNKTEIKLFARKCEIREVNLNECREFLNNHIQGYVNSKIKIGLYYKDELVSLMTFDQFEGRKKMEESGWNLNRFCNKLNTNVIGSASKLLNYFIKTYSPKRIISYADLDWSVGNLYYKLGFKMVNESKPDYKYIISNKRVNKSRYRKSNLISVNSENIDLSESKEMLNRNILKIWDCGKIKFEFTH